MRPAHRAAAVLALLPTALAFGEAPAADAPLRVVRAGRPVSVVVAAGAERVRGPVGPWALPVGDGDEFVVPGPDVAGRAFEVEVEKDGVREKVLLDMTPGPREGRLRAAFTPQDDVPGVVALVPGPTQALPTSREAWLVFDEVDDPPAEHGKEVRAAVDSFRDGPRAALEPLLLPPGDEVFRAAADAAREAPHLPRAVRITGCLLAVLVCVLAVLGAAGGRGATRRVAWIAAPCLMFAAWVSTGDRLPGPIRATSMVVDDGRHALVVVRLAARRAGEFTAELPQTASGAALLRYDTADVTGRDASVGRSLRVPIPAGESRLVAWSVPSTVPAAPPESGVPSAARTWIRGLGLRAEGSLEPASAGTLPQVASCPVIPALAVRVAPLN